MAVAVVIFGSILSKSQQKTQAKVCGHET